MTEPFFVAAAWYNEGSNGKEGNALRLWEETVAAITLPSPEVAEQVARRWDALHVGNGTVGALRDMVVQYAAVVGEVLPEIPKKRMIIAAADHGVAVHQLSAYPIDTTVEMTKNYLISKGAGANALADYAGAAMTVVDAGIRVDLDAPGLRKCKIAYGTQDMSVGPAMTREQAMEAVEIGIRIVTEHIEAGDRVFTVGEMGISNTTSAAAIIGAFGRWTAEEVTGRGTNISDERLRRKIEIVNRALEVNRPDPTDGLDVLAKVGGFEFGVIAGVILGAAAHGALVIIDGFNTTACAHIAKAIAPASRHYVMASHLSAEQAHRRALAALDAKAYVDLSFRLGEASGASVQMRMLDHALSIYAGCLTTAEMETLKGGATC